MSQKPGQGLIKNLKYHWIRQIGITIIFEFRRNLGKMITLIFTGVIIFLLNLLIEQIQVRNGLELPVNAGVYVTTYITFINFYIIIVGCFLGGSLIATDFEKQTGNILFPKIPKDRLFVGRV